MSHLKKPGFTAVEGVVIVALILVIAAIVSMAGKSKTATGDTAATSTESTTTAAKPAAITTTETQTANKIDEAADWKTYTNTKYGFSFKYPNSWRKENNSGEGLIQLYSGPDEGRELTSTETKVVVNVNKKSSYSPDVRTVLENELRSENLTITSDRSITVAGILAEEIVAPTVFEAKMTSVYIPKGENYVEIIWYNNTDMYNSLLKTFQFTN